MIPNKVKMAVEYAAIALAMACQLVAFSRGVTGFS